MPRLAAVVGLLVIASTSTTRGDDSPAVASEQAAFFEAKVRPLLANHCWKCHGPEKAKGGLRLDSRAGALAGGDGGPAVEPGKPEESLLVEAIRHEGLQMPPTGKLAEADVDALVRWVEIGAPWPSSGAVPAVAGGPREKITAEDRAFWSFQPIRRPEVPAPTFDGAWARSPIDRFVAAKLVAEGLTPAAEADRPTLIRRLTLDLWGLPPTPEEVDAFVADQAPDAYERLVDRLLAGPRYAERQARAWLDLVRYGESDGYRADAFRSETWRYRDYVVEAFHRDLPYDHFLAEQIAGDELDPDDPRLRVATTFLRLWPYEFNQRDVMGQWATILNDLTDVTGDAVLGVGIGCARCHDHKFDPILQADYYRLQAFFTPLLPRDDLPLRTPEQSREDRRLREEWEATTVEVRAEIAELLRPHQAAGAADALSKFQPDIQALLNKPIEERTPLEIQLTALAQRQVTLEEELAPEKWLKDKGEKARYAALLAEQAESDEFRPSAIPLAFTATDVGPVSPPTIIPGDRKGRDVLPGPLSVLDERPTPIKPPASGRSTGRRSALVAWLTDPSNPLPTRVLVNRLWQQHFGTGIVATANDFGRLGDRPSHPELLDWLAAEFVAQGWSLKAMHRAIVTSATYRQSARAADSIAIQARRLDPDNRWLWRAPIRRLDAEQVRDALLLAAGELDDRQGGPGVEATVPRRALYVKVLRNARDPLLEAFDAADPFGSSARRNVTTSPMQALLLMNSPWSLGRAGALAERARRISPPDDHDALARAAFRLALGREPTPQQAERARAFLDAHRGLAGSGGALDDLAHALLNTNEFFYID